MGANENQLVELRNGSLLLNSRSLATGSPQQRLQALSHDGGMTFTPSRFVPELPEPFNGCQGSMVRAGGSWEDAGNDIERDSTTNASSGMLYLSHPRSVTTLSAHPRPLPLPSTLFFG